MWTRDKGAGTEYVRLAMQDSWTILEIIPVPFTRCNDIFTFLHEIRCPITCRDPVTNLEPAWGILAFVNLTF